MYSVRRPRTTECYLSHPRNWSQLGPVGEAEGSLRSTEYALCLSQLALASPAEPVPLPRESAHLVSGTVHPSIVCTLYGGMVPISEVPDN